MTCELILVFEFSGSPSEKDCYTDIEAAYDFLRSKLNIPRQNIVLYGRSLGSGPSCHLAAGTASSADGPVGGLILHAPFMSVYRIVVETGCTVYGDKFPNVDYAPMLNSPVLLIHGTNDQIVPFSHSERLYKAMPRSCRARPLFIEGMGHNNVHSAVRPMFVDRLGEYLDQHIVPFVVVSGNQHEYDIPAPIKSSKLRTPHPRTKSGHYSEGTSGHNSRKLHT
jgi:pimeloyl-ACP methyl ester carboxylesterase